MPPGLAAANRPRARAFGSSCQRHHKRGSQPIWIADAHRNGKRFVARADKILPAFLELQTAIHAYAELS
jgi:hypothetical protein